VKLREGVYKRDDLLRQCRHGEEVEVMTVPFEYARVRVRKKVLLQSIGVDDLALRKLSALGKHCPTLKVASLRQPIAHTCTRSSALRIASQSGTRQVPLHDSLEMLGRSSPRM
jgi:hypothetical protein